MQGFFWVFFGSPLTKVNQNQSSIAWIIKQNNEGE